MSELVPTSKSSQEALDLRPGPAVARLRRALSALLRDEELSDRLARLQHSNLNAFGFDPFGYHPDTVRKIAPVLKWIYRYYFRTEAVGVENLPAEGRVLVVANHSGQLPVDGLVVGAACLLDLDPPRMVRAMVERFVPKLPFVSSFFSRAGQILGAPSNCVRLLEADECVLVFPEGARGIAKPPSQAYQLTEFGFGFMRLAIRTGTPIVPVAVIGAEEQYVRLADLKPLARATGLPAFPLFLLGPLPIPGGLIPLPVHYRLRFGPPMRFDGDWEDDDAVIGKKVKQVKGSIQQMIHTGLSERAHIFW